METSIVIPLNVARAVVSKLNPHFLLSTQEKDFWSTPGMDPSYPIERIVQFQERISATPGELETLVSINPDKVEGGKFQVELYVLFPSGNWYSSADSAPYVYASVEVPESMIESLAISVLERFYDQHSVETVAIGIYNIPEQPFYPDDELSFAERLTNGA